MQTAFLMTMIAQAIAELLGIKPEKFIAIYRSFGFHGRGYFYDYITYKERHVLLISDSVVTVVYNIADSFRLKIPEMTVLSDMGATVELARICYGLVLYEATAHFELADPTSCAKITSAI